MDRRDGDFAPLFGKATDDLEVAALSSLFEEHASSSLGRIAIRWLLAHRLTRAQDIRDRQETIKELASSEELREKLDSEIRTFVEFEKGNLGWDKIFRALGRNVRARPTDAFFKDLSTERDPHFLLKAIGVVGEVMTPILGLSFAVAGGRAATLPGASFFAYSNTRRQIGKRQQLSHFQQLIATSEKLAVHLRGAESQHLRKIGETLNSVLDPSNELGLYGTARIMRNFGRGYVRPLIFDIFYVSNFTLMNMRNRLYSKVENFALLASALAELDAYLAFAKQYASQPGMIFPEIQEAEQPMEIVIENGHHPYLFLKHGESVPNGLTFTKRDQQADPANLLFLTGPNSRGKSTYLRMVGLNTILAHLGMAVPAKAMRVSVHLTLLTALKNSDSTADNESTFRRQSRTVANLLKLAETEPNPLLLVDEIFTGTSLNEQLAAEEGFLTDVSERGLFAIVSSHKRRNAVLENTLPGFLNIHASDSEAPGRKYGIEPGVSGRYNAMEIMEEEGIPSDIIEATKAELETISGPQDLFPHGGSSTPQ